MAKTEAELYPPAKGKLEELLRGKGVSFHLEITANGKFSNTLKGAIPQHRDIVFHFLSAGQAPDITGFVKRQNFTEFLVCEVKNEGLSLGDIYQVRRYAELFDARYAFLVSTSELPEELKRLSRVVPSLLALPAHKTLALLQFDKQAAKFTNWFPENPLDKIQQEK